MKKEPIRITFIYNYDTNNGAKNNWRGPEKNLKLFNLHEKLINMHKVKQ